MRRRWCRSRNKYRTQSNETNEELYEDIMMRETEMNDQDRLGIAVQLNFPCWISWGVPKNWYCEKEMKKIQVIDREENECHVNLSRVSLSLFVYGIRVRTETRDPITNPSFFVLPVCVWPGNPWKPKVSVTLFFSAVINSDVPSSLFSKIAGFSGNWSQDKWPAFSVTCPVSSLD